MRDQVTQGKDDWGGRSGNWGRLSQSVCTAHISPAASPVPLNTVALHTPLCRVESTLVYNLGAELTFSQEATPGVVQFYSFL